MIAGIGLAGISRDTAILELGLMAVLDVEGSPWMRTWFVAHRKSMPMPPLHTPLKALIVAEGGRVVEEMEAGRAESPRPKLGRGTIGAIR